MLFWSTVVSFIELCHDISFIASNCFAFWNGNDNSYEVKTNKRTNNKSSHIDAKCMKRQGKFPWEHHELAWISSDFLLRGENDSKQSDEFQANHELHWENN